MAKYDHKKIEEKWQDIWQETNIYAAKDDDSRPKFYNLVMFAYPSGNMHLGHWYNFSGGDFYARYKRMSGFNVLNPNGFDAFGLPAENAAIKNGIAPKKWTYSNIEKMITQLHKIGASYDWDRMVITSDPEYYKWTQWMFLELYNRGLAYKKKQVANWCTDCNTVLANEQAVGGKCDRCGNDVVQKELDQWLFKITDYADELISGLDKIDWPERTKTMQKNWIGRSEGAEVVFKLAVSNQTEPSNSIKVFTTRIDTLFGATFMVLAPENPLVSEITTKEQSKDVEKYIQETKAKTELDRMQEKEKTGVFTGGYAINPVNSEKIPIWISDYVLMGYGTGAIMAVPAHDERDWEFANKFSLPIIEVLAGGDVQKGPYLGDGKHVNSGYLNGLNKSEAIEKVLHELEEDKAATKTINYKLRDWLISRQRYWGAPIPIIYCDKCGEVPVPAVDLPVLLPEEVKMKPTGESPLKYEKDFFETKCPMCGDSATRETDTMDTFVCSSWYFLRYADPKNDIEFANKSKIKQWLPVDMYIGGAEHTVLHLLYSRFFTKALRDGGYIDFDEPFMTLRHQGMILGPDGLKMSKSKGNVIDPDKEVDKYGADAVRMYLAFMGPYDQGGPWNPNGLVGARRFLDKFYDFVQNICTEINMLPVTSQDVSAVNARQNDIIELDRIVARLVSKVTTDISELKYNTCISAFMEAQNSFVILAKDYPIKDHVLAWRNVYSKALLIMAPFAPHLAEQLWHDLGNDSSIHVQDWPEFDKALLSDELVTVVVQINGKVRGEIIVTPNATEAEVLSEAVGNERVSLHLKGKQIVKTIYVPGRLISLVVK